MAIAFDCYPFRPLEFAATIAPYVTDLYTRQDGYTRLRSAALTLFDSDSNVRRLASEYGGWDRPTLTIELTEENPAFCLILFLYAHFFTINEPSVWQYVSLSTMSYITQIAGWSQGDSHVLTHGKRSFKDFAQRWLYEAKNDHPLIIPDFWNHFHPECMYGHLGWLDESDILSLLQKLSELEVQLTKLDFGTNDPQALTAKFLQVQNVLVAATQHNYCLCFIQSA
jgi:hypothetical protein